MCVCVCVWGGEEEREGGGGGIEKVGVQLSCVPLAAGPWHPQGVGLCEGKSSHCQQPCAHPWTRRLPNGSGISRRPLSTIMN